MKIGLFADPHYCAADVLCRTRRPQLSADKIREALEAFRREGAELVVSLGDLTDHCETKEEALACAHEVSSLLGLSGIPTVVIPGNHDCYDFSAEAFAALTGTPRLPFSLDAGGFRFLALDANYRSDFRRFDEAGVEWTDSNLPPDEVSFLRIALDRADRPCVVLIHENLDPLVEPHHIVKNAAEVREILRSSGKVKCVIQGHYHPGADRTIDGVRYLTVPAMCEGEENRYMLLDLTLNEIDVVLTETRGSQTGLFTENLDEIGRGTEA